MGGTAAGSQLSTRFAVVTEADDAPIRRLLRDNPMGGAIRLSFEREPDYFQGANIGGTGDRTIVAYREGKLICMGRCIHRDCWIDGVARRVGYLGELRLDASARGKFGVLRDGYRFFEDMERDSPADLYFTSIASDNERARRLLERGVRGLPTYRFLSELSTLLIAVNARERRGRFRVEAATADRIPDLLALLNAPRNQFAGVWTDRNLSAIQDHGLSLDRFLIIMDGSKAIACGALWDQRHFRQTVIRGYSTAVNMLRPFLRAASLVLGTPRLPPPGAVLPHVFLLPMGFAPGAEALLPDLIEEFMPVAAQANAEYLTVALPATDARLPNLRRRFSTRVWSSRLYRVDWSGFESLELVSSKAPILPDLAFL